MTDENSGTTPDAGWFFLCGETRHCIVQDGVCFVIDSKTLGQFTGIKDKNGKEIYGGDIIIGEAGIPCKVEWMQKHARFHANGISVILVGISAIYFHEREIIGNIFDNPELLEVSHESN